MQPFFVILFLIIAFWSVFTSFKAMFLILTKDFQGDKITWVLIVMIGIIGPILWITKGSKLISKS